jgi:UDP-N-acetylmuramoyl-L-alanyl-D-glutamate--2,6-diaminopimelate ligase
MRKIKNFLHLLQAMLANICFGFPSRNLIVIGVTGTDGKTTTVHLINHLLRKAGFKSELLSSVTTPGLHTTTPSAWFLQKFLRQAVKRQTEYVVLEATSHGLDQHRLLGIKFKLAVMTNLTHEHLDYHQTLKSYLKAKGKLFEKAELAVLNRDDESFNYLKGRVPQKTKILSYALKNEADFTPTTFPFKTSLQGLFNQYNCLAAAAAVFLLGLPVPQIQQGLASFGGVIGRLEEIKNKHGFRVVVDFAHTPNGLENVLQTLRKQLAPKARLIVVFGCAGLRDKKKRPLMGAVAARLADLTVLTAEDPRTEDVNQIINQVGAKCLKAVKIPDRRKAIRYAIKNAQKGDLVVICGKGHERSMCFGRKEIPWSDQEEARQTLAHFKNDQ